MTSNWEAIGAIGEVVGGASVFISLLYLAVQIRSSRRSDQIAAAAAAGAGAAVDEWVGQIVRDEDLYELYWRGLSEYESLSQKEKGRFSLLIVQFMRSTEAIWFHLQLGAIDPGYWSSMKKTNQRVVGSDGGLRCFDRNREFLIPEYVSVLQEILDEPDATEDSLHDVDSAE